jgi:predicted  nucleic acid-binding Zn-ribbon protein
MSADEPASEAVDVLAASRADLEDRVHRLEERLGGLSGKVAALRQSFQEMAIAADERLAAMKEEIDEVRSDTDEA